jgi:crotonobetainyl-CoA:carnitine CoA-transferase CaiB-like acyl-CoA transferase
MLPLDHLRVIEFCTVAAGPFCGMLLADMGADVIKVENPNGGDTLRQWPPINQGDSENFAALNRNKRSVALDLKQADDRERARRLIMTADVVVENNRPGVMERLGLDYSRLKSAHPKLVYCSISAFGQEGPRGREAGFDLTVQAMSGIMSVTGEPDGAPVKCGVPVSDFSAGLYAAFAIAAALEKVCRCGEGTHIDVSLLGASLGISALQTSEYFGTGRDPKRLGSAHPRNAPYQAFRALDGHIALAAGNDGLWRAACMAIERHELVEDSRFATTELRARNQVVLRELLETSFAQFKCRDLIERFVRFGVPCCPINTYSEILNDPHVEHMGWVQQLTLPNGAETKTFGPAFSMSGSRLGIYRRPPALGEHNREVFSEIEENHARFAKAT